MQKFSQARRSWSEEQKKMSSTFLSQWNQSLLLKRSMKKIRIFTYGNTHFPDSKLQIFHSFSSSTVKAASVLGTLGGQSWNVINENLRYISYLM